MPRFLPNESFGVGRSQTERSAVIGVHALTYNNFNGLYLVCLIAWQKEPEGVPTTFLRFLIYCMTHHQEFYVAKSSNNYLTTIRDALKASPTTVKLVLVNLPPRT